jgi:hypothetical protein
MEIINNKKISVGNIGTISKIKALFTRKTKKGKIIQKNKDFIIKEFPNKFFYENSYQIWEILKKIKVSTFTTYKKLENNQILMTNLSTKTQAAISINNSSEDSIKLLNTKITQIPNFIKFLETSTKIIETLSKNNILIIPDVFFILIDKNKFDIYLFLGDFDSIKTNQKNKTKENYINLYFTVKYFLEMYVSEKKQKEYLILLHNYLSKYL